MQHTQHLHPRQGVNVLPTPSVRLPRSERLSGVREAEGLQDDNDFAYALWGRLPRELVCQH